MFTLAFIYVAYQIYAFKDEPLAAWGGLAVAAWADWYLYLERMVSWIA